MLIVVEYRLWGSKYSNIISVCKFETIHSRKKLFVPATNKRAWQFASDCPQGTADGSKGGMNAPIRLTLMGPRKPTTLLLQIPIPASRVGISLGSVSQHKRFHSCKKSRQNTKLPHLNPCLPNSPQDARPLVALLLASQSTVFLNKVSRAS